MVRAEWHDCFSCRITGTVYTFWNLFGGALNNGTRKNNTRAETARTKCMHIFCRVVLKLTPVCTCSWEEKASKSELPSNSDFETLIGTLKQNTKLAYTDKVFCENSIVVNVKIMVWLFEKKIKVKFSVFFAPYPPRQDARCHEFQVFFLFFFRLCWLGKSSQKSLCSTFGSFRKQSSLSLSLKNFVISIRCWQNRWHQGELVWKL